MNYYDQNGNPIDIYGNPLRHHGFRPPYPSHFAQQTSQQSKSEWNLENLGSSGSKNQNDKKVVEFNLIDDQSKIQDLGNKEARLGDIMLYYNPESGDLYKKYVDFISGTLIVEVAKFEKSGDPEYKGKDTITEVLEELKLKVDLMSKEIEDLKTETKEQKKNGGNKK